MIKGRLKNGFQTAFVQLHELTAAQIVLVWELVQRDFIVPIPGTTKKHRLVENFGALQIRLAADELHAINQKLGKMDIDKSYF
ncbi:TPA: aldo/keto reductase [Neisseria subflava]|uniref:aldo/keto reductase n=1 Tax=Neisseria TaxID=482 RepID=UPI00066B0B7B|nr:MULTISPECIES: aldo/keto reductase [Neisseria]